METKKRKNKTALQIYLPDVVFNALKEIAEEQDTTMTRYTLRALLMRMNMERKDKLKI